MFRFSVQGRAAKPTRRNARLFLEALEDRLAPHSGVTIFSDGITANSGPTGIVQGPDQNFWFTEFNSSRIGRITFDGAVTEFTLPAGRGPLNITVGPDSQIWFTMSSGDRIGRINPLAGSDAAIQASLAEFNVPGAGSAPNDITAGPDGALWFTQTGSDQIGRINTAGTVTNEFNVPGTNSAPAGITSGPDGALWFTQAGSGQIGRITTGGTFTEFDIPVPNAGAFSDPEDIVAGPGGALYFTDFGRDQIGRITTDGQITQFNLAVGRGPNQIVAAPDGNLYFTMSASGRLGKLPANALNPGRPTSGSPPLEEFDFIPRDSVPLGLALGGETGSEDIFFTLNNASAIATFEAHLAQITVTATGPTIEIYDIHLNQFRTFNPFPGWSGSLSVEVRDMAGAHAVGGASNGVPDVIVGAGPGAPSQVTIFDGSDNRVLANFLAFDPGWTGGVTVSGDDFNGDGRNDLVVAAGTHIKVIDGLRLGEVQANGVISDSALLASFFVFPPGAVGSVSLAAGDIDGDGFADIIVGAGAGAPAHVVVVSGARLNQVQSNGVIAPSALLASFYAFDPSFTGGVYVAVGFNVSKRDIIVGSGAGAQPHIKVIDSTKLGQVQANGTIADSALIASFFAFGPAFTGGVRVAADDLLNADGVPEIFAAAGPGAGPHVKVIDGSKLGQIQSDGQIADSALIASFFTGNPSFSGGVFIAADADHRDGTLFGPPGVTISNSRNDINDMYIFQSPVTSSNTVLAMTASPFSSTGSPAAFVPGLLYDFRIVNQDLVNASDDLAFRVTFGPADEAGVQDVTVRALPAARFPGTGGVLVKAFTGQNVPIRGVGGDGTAMFRAAEHDDPFFFDVAAFGRFLNGNGLSDGTTADNAAGRYPSGTSNNGAGNPGGLGFGPGQTPDYNGTNFFANANTLAIIFELPSTVLAGLPADATLAPDLNPIGFWGRTEANGVQLDRMGRPAINTALIPPVPRGSMFPADGSAPNRTDVRTAFNTGHPRDDRDDFTAGMVSVLAAVYPIGGNGQAPVVASLLLPDILVYDPTSPAGFFGDTVGTLGQPDFFLAGGRKFSDDVVSTELSVLTDPDTPFNPAMPPLVVTQNVADDNGLNLMDGSFVGPGTALAGMERAAVFPYIGSRNNNPANVPGGNPPPP